eukprot:3071271-Ditylum_brightwellii.AAC.1
MRHTPTSHVCGNSIPETRESSETIKVTEATQPLLNVGSNCKTPYGEGTSPPCNSNVLDERRESPHFHVTYHLYVGARRAKRG